MNCAGNAFAKQVSLVSDKSNQLRLVQEACEGDDEAMATLFGIYRDRLHRMVSFRMDRRLAGRVSTSDVVQDVYIAAAQRLKHFDGERGGSFLGWLRLVAEQTLTDLHRRHIMSQKRNALRETSVPTTGFSPNTSVCLINQIAGTASSPSHQVSRTETAELVEQAINRMDPVDREVLALRHFEELSNGEVAEVLVNPVRRNQSLYACSGSARRYHARVP